MTIETTAIITGVAIVLLAGAIVAVIKHISNSDKHPCKKDVIFRDSCEPKMERLEDCIEGAIDRANTQYENLTDKVDELKKDLKDELLEVKNLIRNDRQ